LHHLGGSPQVLQLHDLEYHRILRVPASIGIEVPYSSFPPFGAFSEKAV
jgi:hypothetical protein